MKTTTTRSIARKGRRVAAVAFMTCAAMAISGCMPWWTGRDMQEDLAQMEARQAELEKEAEKREQELAEMISEAKAEIKELEEVLEEARRILARDSADLGDDVRQTRREITQVLGTLQELEFRHRRLEQSFDLFRDDVDRRFADVEPDELLEKAQKFQEEGEYHLARRALERFLSDHEGHQLEAEARLELGDVYFELEQWESAGSQLTRVSEDSTSRARQAYATYRVAEVFVQMDECDTARLFFEAVVDDFPAAEEVTDAQEWIRRIDRGECPPQ